MMQFSRNKLGILFVLVGFSSLFAYIFAQKKQWIECIVPISFSNLRLDGNWDSYWFKAEVEHVRVLAHPSELPVSYIDTEPIAIRTDDSQVIVRLKAPPGVKIVEPKAVRITIFHR